MASSESNAVGELIERARAGDERAASRLMPVVYDELRRIAGAYMRRERPGQTIQPTALVHEAYLRLLKDKGQDWRGRTHFLAIAATSMRQILVERARARRTAKRGGSRQRITLDETLVADGGGNPADPGDRSLARSLDLLAIDEALTCLAAIDPQQARIVELRFFGGLTIEESAQALGISPATVKRDWTVARAWLRREVRGEPAGPRRRDEPGAGRGGEDGPRGA